jgi:hypothetical protein
MNDEMKDDALDFEMQEDINEIKEAAEQFGKLLSDKAGKQAQKQIEALSDEQLKNRIIEQGANVFTRACNKTIDVIGVAKILGLNDDHVKDLVRQHCEFQVDLLVRLGVELPPDLDVAVKELYDIEIGGVDEFIKAHSDGAHPGCILDEYQKRNSWDELIEEVGHGVN